jgi:hypothetical protein
MAPPDENGLVRHRDGGGSSEGQPWPLLLVWGPAFTAFGTAFALVDGVQDTADWMRVVILIASVLGIVGVLVQRRRAAALNRPTHRP